MLKNSKRLFGEILVSEGHLTKDQLEAALAAQAESGYPLGDVMLQQGWITESDVVKALCIQYQLPFIRPSTYELRADLLQKLPPPFLYQNRLIPLDRFGDCFIVAIADVPAEPVQRELAREIMRYAGPKMMLRHPLLAISHLMDGRREARHPRELTREQRMHSDKE